MRACESPAHLPNVRSADTDWAHQGRGVWASETQEE